MHSIYPDRLDLSKNQSFAFDDSLTRAVVLLGNFDGLHKGHRAVISQAEILAKKLDTCLLMLSFEPHPKEFFNPQGESFRLTPLAIKQRLLEDIGLDGLVILPFDNLLAGISADDFIKKILIDTMAVKAVVVGHDFCFGHNRLGNAKMLADCQSFDTLIVEPQCDDGGQIYSSTRVREALINADLVCVQTMLGRPYELSGQVIKGQQLGRTIGFPTANIDLTNQQRPKYGVYGVKVMISGQEKSLRGIANFGKKPTIGGHVKPVFEVFLFDFDGDLYYKTLSVQLMDFIRDEQKFNSLDELKAQIHKDCQTALDLLS